MVGTVDEYLEELRARFYRAKRRKHLIQVAAESGVYRLTLAKFLEDEPSLTAKTIRAIERWVLTQEAQDPRG